MRYVTSYKFNNRPQVNDLKLCRIKKNMHIIWREINLHFNEINMLKSVIYYYIGR